MFVAYCPTREYIAHTGTPLMAEILPIRRKTLFNQSISYGFGYAAGKGFQNICLVYFTSMIGEQGGIFLAGLCLSELSTMETPPLSGHKRQA